MGLMDRLFGRTPAASSAQRAGPSSAQPSVGPSTRGANSPQAIRKELVRVSVRDTLLHNGIPATWLRAEPLTTSAPGRDVGVHVRLVVQHWDERLMQHAVALQEHVQKRIVSLDPLAERWLMGLSWQFDLEDVSSCPPLPHPGSWTASPAAVKKAEPAAKAQPQPGADVITGPTRIQHAGEDKRKALERILSERDADFKRQESDGSEFGKTQPMGFEKTAPATLQKTEPGQPARRPTSGG
ncbi:hypothetical protein EZ313_13555 [Ramlibacter henchirensis]|uniref:Uncharacterized protein n=1 Tax=Ramlibacter henchirensis TaxID=204072 RepID=A0A4Z0BSN2_9BURK|nr:hypothetical protein [Ramlibacter henchirensis]TFZ02293.1 hypothetical protein EZ313_13555 [Ramlibacter henchirensis]